jgi:DNA-binding NarL/FixJ family response regulator
MSADQDSQKKRIFIVDDHPLVREWLANLINQQSDLEVCGEAASAMEAINLIAAANPHVATVDIAMEGGSGLELIKNLKAACPEVAVIVLSMYDESAYAEPALRAGALGYITKREATKNVLPAIRNALVK